VTDAASYCGFGTDPDCAGYRQPLLYRVIAAASSFLVVSIPKGVHDKAWVQLGSR